MMLPLALLLSVEGVMGRLQDLIEQQRRDLLGMEKAAASRMVASYADIWKRTRPELDALSRQVRQAKAEGKPVSLGSLYRLDRLRALKGQTAEELARFVKMGGTVVTETQREAVAAALRHADDLARAAAGDAPAAAAVFTSWKRLPKEAVEDLVGALSNGSPLDTLFREVAGQASARFGEELTVGLALGLHPTVVARRVRDAIGVGLSRSLRISRTEILRSYRESSRRSFAENDDVVDGWIWHSALDRRTCPACWAMHGSFHSNEERLDGHPNCRCAMVPRTKTWQELGFDIDEDTRPPIETGEEVFKRQPDDVQMQVLGKAGFKVYFRDEVDLVDFVARKDNKEWGTMRYTRSLLAIRESRGGQWVGQAARVSEKTGRRTGADVRRELEKAEQQVTREIAGRKADIAAKRDALIAEYEREREVKNAFEMGSAERTAANKRMIRLMVQVEQLGADERALVTVARARYTEVLAADEPAATYTRLTSKLEPDQETAVEEGRVWFNRVVGQFDLGDAGRTVAVTPTPDRAHYTKGTVFLTKDNRAAVTVHEMGHWLEDLVPRIDQAAHTWRDGRTQGEALVKMSDVTKQAGYRDDEVTRPDKFVNPYVGKDYGAKHTEVISMGLEEMFRDAADFARRDADHFDFVFDLLRGVR